MGRRVGLVWAVWLASAGCAPKAPPPESCADSLAGVWLAEVRAPSGEPVAYHFLDHGVGLEIYPMFDDTSPKDADVPAEGAAAALEDVAGAGVVYAPASFDIRRRGATLVGTRTRRAARAGVTCTISQPAAIRSCDRAGLELSWVPIAHIDWDTCASAGAGRYARVHVQRRDL